MLLRELKNLSPVKGKAIEGDMLPNVYKKRNYGKKGNASLQTFVYRNTATGEIYGSKSIHQRNI